MTKGERQGMIYCNSCDKLMWVWQGWFKVDKKKYHIKCFAKEFPKVYNKIRSVEY